MSKKLDFLKSVSFWCLFVLAIVNFLGQQNILSADIVVFIDTVLGSVVGIRTRDQVSAAIAGKAPAK